ncbi:MFS transporter [Streptomyces sp. NPDC003435]
MSAPQLSDVLSGTPGIRRLWQRQLAHYPDTAPRFVYLGLTVLATIVLYYELYVQGSVSTQLIAQYGFSFREFVFIGVVGNLLGAGGSVFAGLADRWGRANLVVVGLFITGALIAFAAPHAPNKQWFAAILVLVAVVEGIVLVATPALIRDFSPQTGRAAAMGLWTMGPVLGSLLVTGISSHTLKTHTDWRFQFSVCGAVGIFVAVLALFGLRELSPGLRDQLMVSINDRALIEARAAGLDAEQALKGHWRQMLRTDIIVSALAISFFLLFYYVMVSFGVLYFATVFGYTEARANGLANWFWGTLVLLLLVTGLLSDRLRVRKPFMVVGGVTGIVGTVLFAIAATKPATSYHTFVLYFAIIGVGTGMAYVAWMASFTETVERRNPAATATGLAVWGLTVRLVVTVTFTVFPFMLPATSVLADKGTKVEEIVSSHPEQVAVLSTVDARALTALRSKPNDVAARATVISELSGLSRATAAKAITLSARYRDQLATAARIAPATLQELRTDPTNKGVRKRAAAQIADALGVPAGQAASKLTALTAVPAADIAFLTANGPKVENATTRLRSLSTMPAADIAYLSAHGTDVATAREEGPRQWQRWWWICVAAQVLFLPAVLFMAGRWNPKKARQDALDHERLVAAELAKLRLSRDGQHA